MRTFGISAITLAAAASGVVSPVPALASNADWAGISCGMLTVADSRLFGAGQHFGILAGGPVAGAQVTDGRGNLNPALGQAEVECSIQVNEATQGFTTPVATVTGSSITATAAVTQVAFHVGSHDSLYVCTTVRSLGDTVYSYDANPNLSGNQCEPATDFRRGSTSGFVVCGCGENSAFRTPVINDLVGCQACTSGIEPILDSVFDAIDAGL